MKTKILFPKWFEGCWWITSVRQRARWAPSSEVCWLDPFHWKFEVIGEEAGHYILKVTYPERPDSLGKQYAQMWISKADFKFVKGTLHMGENDIPMKYDFLASVLRDNPPGVDLSGILGEERILKGHLDQESSGELVKTHTVRTPTGGIVVSSPELPYHLRIHEENYSVELEAWSSERDETRA